MDTRVPADDGGWPAPAAPGSIEDRLAAIEARLESLERTVADELQSTGEDFRRAVSDLGRLLLRDLDRLTKVLAEHRDAIVERVTAASAPPPLPVVPAAPEDAPSDDASDIPDETAKTRSDDGKRRVVPGRRKARRSPQADAGSDTRNG